MHLEYAALVKCIVFQQISHFGSALGKGTSLAAITFAGFGSYVIGTILFFRALSSKAESLLLCSLTQTHQFNVLPKRWFPSFPTPYLALGFFCLLEFHLICFLFLVAV